jgi:hypothetical protein
MRFLGVKSLPARKNNAREAVFGDVFKGFVIVFPVTIIPLDWWGRKRFFIISPRLLQFLPVLC